MGTAMGCLKKKMLINAYEKGIIYLNKKVKLGNQSALCTPLSAPIIKCLYRENAIFADSSSVIWVDCGLDLWHPYVPYAASSGPRRGCSCLLTAFEGLRIAILEVKFLFYIVFVFIVGMWLLHYSLRLAAIMEKKTEMTGLSFVAYSVRVQIRRT